MRKSLNLTASILMMTALHVSAEVKTYPPMPSLSDLYSVTVNGQVVAVEKLRSQLPLDRLPEWFTSEPYTREQQEVHIAAFSCSGETEVRIAVAANVGRVSVRPRSKGIAARTDGNVVAFRLPGPEKLYIEIDDLPPLLFFADPPEQEAPAADAPRVRRFGPGVHHVGMITLQDDETFYLEAGALVYGGLRAKGARNIRVMGRGVLDGGYEMVNMVKLEDCVGVVVEGITIRNGVNWTNTLVNCTDVVIRGVKVISFGPSGDGVNPVNSRNVTIEGCFLRCTDDCVAIKTPRYEQPSHDILVADNTMIGFAFSDGVTIGFETNAPIRNVTVRNCDILQARGGSRVDGHSAFSIICDGPALIEDVCFENLRVAADVRKAFELNVTDGTLYGEDPPGHIRNIRLKGIAWEAPRPIILSGHDPAHRVENVAFNGCSIAGEPLLSARQDVFRINEFVDGVTFHP